MAELYSTWLRTGAQRGSAEVGDAGPLRALPRGPTPGTGERREKPGASALPIGPLVLTGEPGSLLSSRLEAFLLMGGKQRLMPKMNFLKIGRVNLQTMYMLLQVPSHLKKRLLT